MEYSYRFRIYPTIEQEHLIQRIFGCCRFVFNFYLAKCKKSYEQKKEVLSYHDCNKDMIQLKKSKEWLNEADSSALQSSLRGLEMAYKHFFRRIKNGQTAKHPRFKSKRSYKQSYKTTCVYDNIKVFKDLVELPKLGKVKCRISKQVEGRILSATIVQKSSGKYFIRICCTNVKIKPFPSTAEMVGLDMGIKSFAVASDGTEYYNHRYFSQSEKKLAKLQHQLSRKTRGSKRYEKARIKVAKLHEHIANQRSDMLHKLSTQLVKENDIICIEGLNIRRMIRDHKFSKSISDLGWGEFRRQLTYKTTWYEKELIVIDRFYPSSQLCSACGVKWAGVKDLSVRQWTCPRCGVTHNRDVNAAKNILNEGLRIFV